MISAGRTIAAPGRVRYGRALSVFHPGATPAGHRPARSLSLVRRPPSQLRIAGGLRPRLRRWIRSPGFRPRRRTLGRVAARFRSRGRRIGWISSSRLSSRGWVAARFRPWIRAIGLLESRFRPRLIRAFLPPALRRGENIRLSRIDRSQVRVLVGFPPSVAVLGRIIGVSGQHVRLSGARLSVSSPRFFRAARIIPGQHVRPGRAGIVRPAARFILVSGPRGAITGYATLIAGAATRGVQAVDSLASRLLPVTVNRSAPPGLNRGRNGPAPPDVRTGPIPLDNPSSVIPWALLDPGDVVSLSVVILEDITRPGSIRPDDDN